MEEEEREAQSAKLQELIRRGTPEDLREANRLMKIMAGYDTRSKVDYRAKFAEEVQKVREKARLLDERLDNFKPGDKLEDGDVFSELAAALCSAQPKIQKMCEEESDDHEAVAKLLEINDSINRTIERYKRLKKGDIEGANQVAKGGSKSAGKSNELSLIDLDDNQPAPQPAVPSTSTSKIEDDLLGLSIGDTGSSSSSTYGQTGSIALGFGANTSMTSPLNDSWVAQANHHALDIPGPALLSSLTQANSAKGQVPTSTPPPASFPSLSFPNSQSGTPQPQKSAFSPPPPQPQVEDPFAALASLSSSSKPTSPSPAPASAPAPAAVTSSNDDDEWNFASALPPEAPPVPKELQLQVSNSSLRIDMMAKRLTDADPPITLMASFSNNTTQMITELHFQLAVTKVCSPCSDEAK